MRKITYLFAAIILAYPIATRAADATRELGSAAAKPNPETVIERITEDTRRSADGTVLPSTGRARPVENWFGCKPGNTRDACDAEPPAGVKTPPK